VPGAGAILAFIEAATETEPIVIGKPSPRMYRVAVDRMQTSLEETLIVGDRLETDIAGGQSLGCPTALVLTGVTTIAKALEWQPAPTLITENLSSLLEML
jgi:4-nitrophenyl phosphatase